MSRGVKKISTPKVKVKKPRGKSVAHIKLGDEPTFLLPSTVQLARALNWYNQTEPSREQKRDWVLTYMKGDGYSQDDLKVFASRYTKLLDTWAFVARMSCNGTTFEDHQLANLGVAIRNVIRREEKAYEIDDDGNIVHNNVVPIHKAERYDPRIGTLCNFIDGQMDEVLLGKKIDKDIFTKLTNMGCNAAIARNLKQFYKPQAVEFTEVLAGKDEQLNEGYSHLTKKVRKAISEFMAQLIADLASFEQVKKAVRRPRKKRAVKIENVVKRLKFLASSTEFKIASIDPVKIIGSSVLWTFNTKTRQLGYIESDVAGGLSIKGTTVINGKGEIKKVRTPEATLTGFSSGTKANLQNKFKTIKAVPVAHTCRINAHIILLKVL